MSSLAFPARVVVRTQVFEGGRLRPYQGSPLVFGVQTFARAKNDYHLGPLFTDERGILIVTNRQLELCASAELSTGLMDYVDVHDAFSFVEIVHWAPEEVARAIRARTSTWTSLLDGEEELYGSIEALLTRLRQSGNDQFAPPAATYGRLRDEWTDPARVVEYSYSVTRVAAA